MCMDVLMVLLLCCVILLCVSSILLCRKVWRLVCEGEENIAQKECSGDAVVPRYTAIDKQMLWQWDNLLGYDGKMKGEEEDEV